MVGRLFSFNMVGMMSCISCMFLSCTANAPAVWTQVAILSSAVIYCYRCVADCVGICLLWMWGAGEAVLFVVAVVVFLLLCSLLPAFWPCSMDRWQHDAHFN